MTSIKVSHTTIEFGRTSRANHDGDETPILLSEDLNKHRFLGLYFYHVKSEYTNPETWNTIRVSVAAVCSKRLYVMIGSVS